MSLLADRQLELIQSNSFFSLVGSLSLSPPSDFKALLSGTLRTIQRAACDGETLTLRCPLGTAVSIQLAQYGRPAPGISICPAQDKDLAAKSHRNDSCAPTPTMQVRHFEMFRHCSL